MLFNCDCSHFYHTAGTLVSPFLQLPQEASGHVFETEISWKCTLNCESFIVSSVPLIFVEAKCFCFAGTKAASQQFTCQFKNLQPFYRAHISHEYMAHLTTRTTYHLQSTLR